MDHKSEKVIDFLERVSTSDIHTHEERKAAWNLLLRALKTGKNLKDNQEDMNDIAATVSTIRKRLADVNVRLDLAMKSGISNDTIH